MTAQKNKTGFKEKFRYRFDNMMSAGIIALVGWLGIISVLIIIIAAVIITATGFSQEDSESLNFIEAAWSSLMRTLDPGTMGQDTGWGFRVVMLGVTLGGIFAVSALIGVISNTMFSRLEELRKGRSPVLETDHSLILGWSSKIFPVISELVIANSNKKSPRIVILADKDKVEMEDEIKTKIGNTLNTKVICRSGNPIDLDDIDLVNPNGARSIIILAPETSDPDIHVIKTILAITNNQERKPEPYHIIAEITKPKNLEIARMIADLEVSLIHPDDLISRITVQTCRQSGLSTVYTELLDFGGDEIYFQEETKLTGKKFREALLSYEDSCVIGIRFNDGRIKVNPPMDTVISEGDKMIAVSEDDDTVKLSGLSDYGIDENAIVKGSKTESKKERNLILGWNKRAHIILKELDNYVAPGSLARVLADSIEAENHIKETKNSLKNLKVEFSFGDSTDRNTIESVKPEEHDHVIILCYSDTLDHQEADAKTLISLLHLRKIIERSGAGFSIVSEMLDIKNKELAEVTKADDFIVSNRLISLMMSQLSENKELKPVFDDLFDAEGSEIYLKPAGNYIQYGKDINFYTVVESAARKGETAIGYKLNRFARDPEKSYGVIVNPDKSQMINFGEKDKVIVIAEE